MGCDIHLYEEWRVAGGDHWNGRPRFNPGRDYRMFNLIAGIRGSGEAVVPVKGLPDDDMTYYAHNDAYLRVTDDPAQAEWDGWCSAAQAAQWGNPISPNKNGRLITPHPDWHSHTWLTAEDLKIVLGHYFQRHGLTYNPVWAGILASMEAISEWGAETRLVIWFDN